MPETPAKFYLTTPIYYVNARPHIGHAYSTIAADVLARRHRLLGDDTFFLTGTDEHGQKVQRSAEAAGIPPQQFADQVSATFKALWDRMGILNDSLSKNDPLLHRDYIRTTDPRHKRGVQKLFEELWNKGYIELDKYTGAYCVSDEAFVDAPVGTPCPTCGRVLEEVTEENFFFKLSAFQEKLIDLIESGELKIQPETAKNEVLSFVRGDLNSVLYREEPKDNKGALVSDLENEAVSAGDLKRSPKGTLYVPGALKDLSISRTTFDWGIAVPESVTKSAGTTQKHVVYVWLDALANYITAIGYGAEDRDDLTLEQRQAELAKFAKYWPADIHLVGKEITRFHCVYWPSFLMAAGIATPKSVVANGWLLFEESKMSKSRGNVVRTETILDAFGEHYRASLAAHNKKQATESKSAVILSGARSVESKDPEAAHATPAAGTSQPQQPALVPEPGKRDCDLFAADVLRYFLLREIPFGQDGSFSFDALITRYNADLANGYGNLVSRTLSMIEKYCDGRVPEVPDFATSGVNDVNALHGNTANTNEYVQRGYEDVQFDLVTKAAMHTIGVADGFITAMAPWKMAAAKDDSGVAMTLYTAAQSIRIITALLYPVMPHTTAKVWAQLGLGSIEQAARNGELKDLKWGGLQPGTKLGPLAPIFPRADKGLAQIMTDMENPSTPATQTPAPEQKAGEPTAEALNAVSPATDQNAAPADPQPAAAEPAGANPPLAPQITIDDFAKVDLRVAKVLVAERIPKADKLLRLEVDLGFEKRQVLAGIAEYYTPEQLIGRKVVIVANLAPRKMRGLESNGMVVAASVGEHGAPVLVGFAEDVELGARLK